MQGFVIFDHADVLRDGARATWRSGCAKGRLQYVEEVLDGIEHAPDAIAGLYRGENLGKRLIRHRQAVKQSVRCACDGSRPRPARGRRGARARRSRSAPRALASSDRPRSSADAVLGDHRIGQVARQGAQRFASSAGTMRDTPPLRAVDRRQIEQPAAGRRQGALRERRQAAGAGLDRAARALGIDLAEQVDLDRAVDRDEARNGARSRRTSWVCATSVSHNGSRRAAKSWKRRVAQDDAGRDARVAVQGAGAPTACAARAETMPPWIRSRRCDVRRRPSATGTAPMPNCSVSPSRTSARDVRADARFDLAAVGLGEVEQGRVALRRRGPAPRRARGSCHACAATRIEMGDAAARCATTRAA